MPFRFVIGPDGKQKIEKMPSTPQEQTHSCGLCDDSGVVEEHQFCSCETGQRLLREETRTPKPKISLPPPPTNNDLSAFKQRNNLGEQLDLFKDF